MENENQNFQSTPSTNTNESKPKQEGVVGPIIGSIIVILILILGGLYYFRYLKENSPKINPPAQNEEQELNQIQKEINSEDLKQVDAELEAIEAEINQALTE